MSYKPLSRMRTLKHNITIIIKKTSLKKNCIYIALFLWHVIQVLYRVKGGGIIRSILPGGSCYSIWGHPGVDRQRHGCTHLHHGTFWLQTPFSHTPLAWLLDSLIKVLSSRYKSGHTLVSEIWRDRAFTQLLPQPKNPTSSHPTKNNYKSRTRKPRSRICKTKDVNT